MRIPRTRHVLQRHVLEQKPDVGIIDETNEVLNRLLTIPTMGKAEFDENDHKIINATLKAFESRSLTPLIKEELRCTIQSRRLAEGKDEMKVEFKTPARKKEMDEDERNRAVKRRQQNREAAQRFRQRQKDTSDYLTAKIRKLEKNANALSESMTQLKDEKVLLEQMLKDHMSVCSNPHIITHSSTLFKTTSIDHTNTVITSNEPSPSPNTHQLWSTSSLDSNLTYEFNPADYTPSTGTSDTASVFFNDDVVSPLSEYSNSTNDNNFNNSDMQQEMEFDDTTPDNSFIPTQDILVCNSNLQQDNNNIHSSEIQVISADNGVIKFNTLYNVNNDQSSPSPKQNIVIYDGEKQLDGCYGDIIIDFSDTDPEFMKSDGRARGDSCSSVDTISSNKCRPNGSNSPELTELTPISESYSVDLSCYSTNIPSAYSGIHNIIGQCNENKEPNLNTCNTPISMATDFFLM